MECEMVYFFAFELQVAMKTKQALRCRELPARVVALEFQKLYSSESRFL